MSSSPNLPTEPPENPPACDCHFHIFSAPENAADARYVPAYSATLQDWENRAHGVGVQRGVVVQPSFLGADNRQLLEALAQRSLTLRGVAVVDSTVTAAKLQELHDAGVRGIRLNLMGVQDDMGALRAPPASWWSALMAADMHVELHADIGRIGTLLPMLPREITVVLDHFAKPVGISTQDDTVRAVRARNQQGGDTYVTLSGAYRQHPANTVRCGELALLWRDTLGADRLLWGSDWPCTNFASEANYAALFGALRAWLPDVGDWQTALAVNAQQLYWR